MLWYPFRKRDSTNAGTGRVVIGESRLSPVGLQGEALGDW